MPYNVIVDHPEAGDTDLYIHGLGTFHNGTTTEVSDEQVASFQAAHSIVDHETDPETGALKFLPQLGAHPVDLDIYGVRVEAAKKTKTPDKTEKTEEGGK